MSKWKCWIGVLLIVSSVAGMIYWELQGRQVFLMRPVLVAARSVPAGMPITPEDLMVLKVPEECLIEGAISEAESASLMGRPVREGLVSNQQITESCFMKPGEQMEKEESLYVLPETWITMRSSAVRRGDRVLLYGASSLAEVGEYRVAFVKDETEQEVTDIQGGLPEQILERTGGTGQITHLEIITTLEEYDGIRQAAAAEGGLLVVQKPFSGGESL